MYLILIKFFYNYGYYLLIIQLNTSSGQKRRGQHYFAFLLVVGHGLGDAAGLLAGHLLQKVAGKKGKQWAGYL